YTLSFSARSDESKIDGVKANQRRVPVWASGLIWDIGSESFYHFNVIPKRKLRFTYGYNGNVDKSVSAYLTARMYEINYWGAQSSSIVNPPNPSLRWERNRNINFGLDYASKNNLFSGSIEYYIKNGIDLMGNSPIAPQTSIIEFKGNTANIQTKGVDFMLNKNSIGNSDFQWSGTVLFSYNKDIITNYKVKQPNNAQIVIGNYVNPVEGYPYNAIFSYPYRGLDKEGKPIGMLNNETSQDYSSITNSKDISNLIYSGSATPLYYGSVRNDISFRNFELSINIVYKLNYNFRRSSVFSGSNYDYTVADFDKRWQKPGDELITNIPALTYPINYSQDGFYRGIDALIERADNIRIQDI